jgi:ribosomal protein L32
MKYAVTRNHLSSLIQEGKRRNYNATLERIAHRYMLCPRCGKSLVREKGCANCGWYVLDGVKR